MANTVSPGNGPEESGVIRSNLRTLHTKGVFCRLGLVAAAQKNAPLELFFPSKWMMMAIFAALYAARRQKALPVAVTAAAAAAAAQNFVRQQQVFPSTLKICCMIMLQGAARRW